MAKSVQSRLLKAALAAILLFAIWVFGAWFLAQRLIVQKPLDKADVIVVLAGSAVYKERMAKAAELFKTGVADKIVLTNDGQQSGWSNMEKRNPYFVERAQSELVTNGVPAEKIETLAPIVESTRDEAILIGDEIQKRGWKQILVVTSAYHSRRSLWFFEKHAVKNDENIGIVSPPTGLQTPDPAFWWLYRRGWNVVAGEYIKSAYYALN